MSAKERFQDRTWHALDMKDILKVLNTQLTGLTTEEAHKRLDAFGYNELEIDKKKLKLLLLIDQFKSPIILILIGAALISF
ncbi:MAG: cation-transporting P-type ATPase, partial [Promethearchaeota archaeon]